MGNQWGANLSTIAPQQLIAGGDVACPAGTSTPITTGQSTLLVNPGGYVVIVDCTIAILLGATPPTNITVQLTINNGATLNTYNVPPALLVAGATILVPIRMVAPEVTSIFAPPGAPVNILLRPTAQAVTFKAIGSSAWLRIERGPDI